MLEKYIIEEHSGLVAQSCGQILSFQNWADAVSAALEWNTAQGHLDAWWTAREMTQEERKELGLSDYTRIKPLY